MNSDRIKTLEQFVSEDPIDPFNHYALALELAKSNKQRAKEIFDRLMVEHPDYVAAYYQAATLYLAMSLFEGAASIIDKGIAQATVQNNLKAANELRALQEDM